MWLQFSRSHLWVKESNHFNLCNLNLFSALLIKKDQISESALTINAKTSFNKAYLFKSTFFIIKKVMKVIQSLKKGLKNSMFLPLSHHMHPTVMHHIDIMVFPKKYSGVLCVSQTSIWIVKPLSRKSNNGFPFYLAHSVTLKFKITKKIIKLISEMSNKLTWVVLLYMLLNKLDITQM